MSDRELAKLRKRMDELDRRVIRELESRTQSLFAQIMPLRTGSEEREKLEAEYKVISKELRLRSDERIDIRRQMERLQGQGKARR